MKIKSKIRYSAGILMAFGISITSCGKFGDTNVSPNAVTTPVTSALLTSVETRLGAEAVGSPTSTASAPINNFYTSYFVQHWSQIQYPDNSLYTTGGVSWDGFYAGALEDLYNIIQVDKANPNPVALSGNTVNQMQIARILKAYYFSILTDRYGDVPYFGALSGNLVVAYDKQQAIYTDLFNELASAVSSIQSTGNPITGDIIYGGDMSKWRRFANSLRLSLALRLSKVDPTTGKTQFMAALADAGGVIDANTYNFNLVYPGGTFNFPLYNLAIASVVAISQPLEVKMNSYQDPRIYRYGQALPSTAGAQAGKVVGFPYGLNRSDAQAFIVNNPNYSLAFDASLKTSSSTAYIFTAAYVDLLRAEAAITYTTGENPATLLAKGITDSWQQWGVKYTYATATSATPVAISYPADVVTYIANIGASGVPSLAKIQEQEWLALYGSEQNAWDEWRRTGVPALTPAPDATNPSKQIPRRFQYPATEPNTNPTSYAAAISSFPYGGTDNEVNRVWWDK